MLYLYAAICVMFRLLDLFILIWKFSVFFFLVNKKKRTSEVLEEFLKVENRMSHLSTQVRMGAKSASSTKPPSAQSRKPSSGLRSGNKPPNKSRADFVATPSAAAAETLQTTIARIEKARTVFLALTINAQNQSSNQWPASTWKAYL